MGTNTENAKNLCQWLEQAKTSENYKGIITAFNQPGCFRSMWANVGEGNKLYRSRKHHRTELDIKFDNSTELGYRRKNTECIGYGRCNKREQSILYLTHHRDTSLIECLQESEKGEQYTMSVGQWLMRETVPVMNVPQPNKEKRMLLSEIQLGELYDKHVEEMVIKYPDYKEFSNIFFDYMNDKFKSEERGYSYQITAAYSNLCYEADDGRNYGVIYVSVAHKENFNIAFKKAVEDEKKVVLKNVFKIKLEVLRDKPVNYDTDLKLLEIEQCKLVNEDGTIIW